MPNTFLNTGRAVSATSNPAANVEQVATSNAQQPVSSNVNTVQPTQQNNAVNPITIPIQIQPQVSIPGMQQGNVQQVQPVQELQRTNDNQAPMPQTYRNNNTSNNVVDFNQIYSSYQNSFGNNASQVNNTYSSGIKKTSIGTTIVTPTTANLNSVTGQYQSAYADTINGIISEMLNQMKTGFQYDPTTDNSLRVASEYAANSTLQSLAGSGVLNSSATAERVARIVSELIPQYEEKAHSRWTEYLGQLADTAQIVMQYDSQQFSYWKDAKDREFKEKEFEYQKQQDALTNAWKRVDELGFVDNQASAILGVKVGTLSGAAREAKEQREYELSKMREQAQIEYQNNVALAKIRSELDLQQSKALKEYDYELQKKYGTSKKETTSLNTYKDIINNRYADYDEFSKKYTVSDNNALYNYLTSEYAAGRMSANDLSSLTAMYGVLGPSGNKAQSLQNAKNAAIKLQNSANSILRGRK